MTTCDIRHLLIALIVVAVGTLLATTAMAQSRGAYCSRVANDYAFRNAGGGAIGGAVRGRIRGGITGRIIDGDKGGKRGRRIGGTVGAIGGAARRGANYDYLYNQEYQRCMRG